MSDYLPLELQLNIMKKLPAKSLLQFRSVSKAWKSVIDSADFVKHYSSQQQHLLVRYNLQQKLDHKPELIDDILQYIYRSEEPEYVSIVDDDTFPEHKVSPTLPLLVNMLKHSRIIGCSHGLLCLFGDYYKNRRHSMALLWNLSIRKTVAVVLPHWIHGTVLGFGVCCHTNDPKIVRITNANANAIDNSSRQVDIFTLSTGAWRSSSNNLPRESIRIFNLQQVVDGFLYWLATEKITMDGGSRSCNLIVSFDIANEQFREVNLPNSLAQVFEYMLSISKLKESLVVLERDVEAKNLVCSVWMMEDGDPKAFTKLYNVSVNTPHESRVMAKGFRKTGEAIIEITEDDRGQLFVYDPHSKNISNLGIDGEECSFYVYSYMETLLLLDQPNLTVYK